MAQKTRQLKRTVAKEKKPRISRRLKLETEEIGKPSITRHPFQSALKISMLSAALLLPFGTVDTVFTDKAPLHSTCQSTQTVSRTANISVVQHSNAAPTTNAPVVQHSNAAPYSYITPMDRAMPDGKVHIRKRIAYQSVILIEKEFKRHHPHSVFIAQDFSVIDSLNAHLPKQKRFYAVFLITHQRLYLHQNQDRLSPGLADSVQAAINRTESMYSKRIATEEAYLVSLIKAREHNSQALASQHETGLFGTYKLGWSDWVFGILTGGIFLFALCIP